MTVVTVLAQTGAKGRDLPVEPWAVGVGAFLLLVVLLLITMTFGKDR